MLAALSDGESDRLWWRLVRAMAAVADEMEALKLAPAAVRDGLYGAGCLESYTALLAELAELADNDVSPTAASWTDRLDDTTEEGTPQWHDSETPAKTPMTIRFALLLRQTAARSVRRLMPPR